jgi:hypothetical protein
MSFKTAFQLSGKWTMQLHGPDGQLKKQVVGSNVICTNGKEFLASFFYSAAVAASTFTCKYIAIGTDSTAEAAAQTALGTESARHTGTVSYVSNQIYRVTATFGAGTGTGAIVEYGLFSSSSAGTMLARDTEAVINKGAGDTLTVKAEITVG